MVTKGFPTQTGAVRSEVASAFEYVLLRLGDRVIYCDPDRKKAKALCPCHNDRNASLSIQSRDRRVTLHCYAGCIEADILAALHIDRSELFHDSTERRGKALETPEAEYPYVDRDGVLLFHVLRLPGKEFRTRNADGEWNIRGVQKPLYHLPEVLAAAQSGRVVYVTEGEKDADNLRLLGLVATTNAFGAKAPWEAQYTDALIGATVVLLPDNDEAGKDRAKKVAQALHTAGIPCKVLSLPGLPEKGDVTDWLLRGGTVKALETLVENTATWKPQRPGRPDKVSQCKGWLRSLLPAHRDAVTEELLQQGYGEKTIQRARHQLGVKWTCEGILYLTGQDPMMARIANIGNMAETGSQSPNRQYSPVEDGDPVEFRIAKMEEPVPFPIANMESTGTVTEERDSTVVEGERTSNIAAVPVWIRDDAGAELLRPYLPVIQAAHQGELAGTCNFGGVAIDLNTYICQMTAEIWYGVPLAPELLTARLAYLTQLQGWYDQNPAPEPTPPTCWICRQRPASGTEDSPNWCAECAERQALHSRPLPPVGATTDRNGGTWRILKHSEDAVIVCGGREGHPMARRLQRETWAGLTWVTVRERPPTRPTGGVLFPKTSPDGSSPSAPSQRRRA